MCEVALDVAWYAQSQSTTNNNNHRLNVDRTFNFRPGKSSKLRSDRYDEKRGYDTEQAQWHRHAEMRFIESRRADSQREKEREILHVVDNW